MRQISAVSPGTGSACAMVQRAAVAPSDRRCRPEIRERTADNRQRSVGVVSKLLAVVLCRVRTHCQRATYCDHAVNTAGPLRWAQAANAASALLTNAKVTGTGSKEGAARIEGLTPPATEKWAGTAVRNVGWPVLILPVATDALVTVPNCRYASLQLLCRHW
jgi:hypothetical protein